MKLLRKLIQEYIEEMAFGGVLKGINLKGNEEFENPEATTHYQIEKFHSSKLFHAKGHAAFKHFPFDIWIMPISVPDYEKIFDMEKRYRAFDIEEIVERLKKYNIDVPEKQLRSIVGSGGCVIMSTVGGLGKGGLPTPWMIIHGLFDSYSNYAGNTGMSLMLIDLHRFCSEINLSDRELYDHMTMKSAIKKEINGGDDLYSELLTQEIITTGGVKFKDSDDPKISRKLELIKHKIKSFNLKEKISNMFKGKVVVVETASM